MGYFGFVLNSRWWVWQVGKPLEFWTFAPFIDSALAAIPRKNTIEVRNRALPLVIGVGKPDPPLTRWVGRAGPRVRRLDRKRLRRQ